MQRAASQFKAWQPCRLLALKDCFLSPRPEATVAARTGSQAKGQAELPARSWWAVVVMSGIGLGATWLLDIGKWTRGGFSPKEKHCDSDWPLGYGLQRKGRLRTLVGVGPALPPTSGPLPLEVRWGGTKIVTAPLSVCTKLEMV